MHSLAVGSQKLKNLLALALALVSCSRSRSRYWYYIILHITIGKRRSGAFKQKKVYQNRTIIKEVISKNVFFLLALALVSCSRSRSRYWYYIILHTTIGKRRSGAFKQKKVYQNRTIIKEVISKNVFFLLALGTNPRVRTRDQPPGSGPGTSPRGPVPGPTPGVRSRDQPPGSGPGTNPRGPVPGPTPGVRSRDQPPGSGPGTNWRYLFSLF